MKKSILIMAIALLIGSPQAHSSVDNEVEDVDKSEKQTTQVVCEAVSSENENYVLKLTIGKEMFYSGRAPNFKDSFNYELKNLNTNKVLTGGHDDWGFRSSVQALETQDELSVQGYHQSATRIGEHVYEDALIFAKNNETYFLQKVKSSFLSSHPSKFLGANYEYEINFVSSVCKLEKIL